MIGRIMFCVIKGKQMYKNDEAGSGYKRSVVI